MSVSPFAALAQTLRERHAVIADRAFYARDPAGHLARLQAASEQIAALTQALPPPVDPQLRHFLERCSFEKALTWLEQHASAAG